MCVCVSNPCNIKISVRGRATHTHKVKQIRSLHAFGLFFQFLCFGPCKSRQMWGFLSCQMQKSPPEAVWLSNKQNCKPYISNLNAIQIPVSWISFLLCCSPEMKNGNSEHISQKETPKSAVALNWVLLLKV